ncbi:MAG TPA: FmdB family zinc ribbon protein [Gemmatimonadales bacterium]|jgi:putative FmdB family regulatory protein
MPTYEYRCDNGHTFECVQKMSEAALTTCTVCGAPAERVISGGAGVIFKGTGFYITDYGKDGKGPRKEPEGASAPKPESSSAAESPAKPAAAVESKPASAPASTPDSK